MSDKSMCKNSTCPLKDKCYMYTAQPNPLYQSYSDFKYRVVKGGKLVCEYFIDLDKR